MATLRSATCPLPGSRPRRSDQAVLVADSPQTGQKVGILLVSMPACARRDVTWIGSMSMQCSWRVLGSHACATLTQRYQRVPGLPGEPQPQGHRHPVLWLGAAWLAPRASDQGAGGTRAVYQGAIHRQLAMLWRAVPATDVEFGSDAATTAVQSLMLRSARSSTGGGQRWTQLLSA